MPVELAAVALELAVELVRRLVQKSTLLEEFPEKQPGEKEVVKLAEELAEAGIAVEEERIPEEAGPEVEVGG